MPVAVVGLSVIVPGAHTPDRFYENLLRQRCFVRDIPPWLWDRDLYLSADPDAPNASYAAIAALVEDPAYDLESLRIPPSVAKRMSRSQKMGLYCAREALRDAGFGDGRAINRDKVSVIMAAIAGGEFLEAICQSLGEATIFDRLRKLAAGKLDNAAFDQLLSSYEKNYPRHIITEDSLPGASPNLVAGRIASAFDFHGMNLSLDAACASSLTALNLAVRSLQTGESDLVLAGGVDTWIDVSAFVEFAKITALAKTGCYPFDERANGLVLGEGCGVAVLKRLEDAQRDGDKVYAVIRGVGTSSDGRSGGGITAPSAAGQVLAMRRAYESASVSPAELDYIECHGTGTKVGDPIELESMRQLLAGEARGGGREIPISSVKASIGHLRTAAGMAGLCNAVKIIQHRVIPPQINFETPTSGFDWADAPLRVAVRHERLEKDSVTVGVSGYGFGGTNCHVVLGSPPPNRSRSGAVVIPFTRSEVPELAGDTAFLFPGQGSQYVGMLREAADTEIGRALLARADAIVKELCGTNLSSVIYPKHPSPDDEQRLRATVMAQPAIFTVSAIVLGLVRKAGIECAMVLGHSLGEYTALYAAGVLSFDDAVRAVTVRGRLMASPPVGAPSGTMAYLLGTPEELDPLLAQFSGRVVRANLNSYGQTVVAGEAGAVGELVLRAKAAGLDAERLNVDQGFHSSLVSHAVEPMRRVLESMDLQHTDVPMPANISGEFYPTGRPGEPFDAAARARLIQLLASQVDHAVDFVSQVEWAHRAGIRRFIEIGPRRVLTGLVDDILQGKDFQLLPTDVSEEPVTARVLKLPGLLAEDLQTRRQPLKKLKPAIEPDEQQQPVDLSGLSLEERVRTVVAQVSGYDPALLRDDQEFERDLGLDSLKIVDIVSRLRGDVIPAHHRGFRHLTSIERIIAVGKETARQSVQSSGTPDAHEFRCHRNLLRPARKQAATVQSSPNEVPLVLSVTTSLALCRDVLPDLLLRAVEHGTAKERNRGGCLALVTHGGALPEAVRWFRALTGFMRSVALEFPAARFSYHHIQLPEPKRGDIARCLADDAIGRWLAPDDTWLQTELDPLDDLPNDTAALARLLTASDVVLVTGGARGIAARVVQSLLTRTEARFLLIGQRKETEPWIAEQGGGRAAYLTADICDRDALRALNLRARGVTFVLHAAGLSYLTPLKDKPRSELDRVVGVKALGLDFVLGELDTRRLRGIVNFSSIVGHFGNLAQADYAAANGYLDGYSCPGVPVLSIGWTAWDDVGMATRGLTRSVMETSGIAMLPAQRGVEIFELLLAWWLGQQQRDATTTIEVFGELGVSLRGKDQPAATDMGAAGGSRWDNEDIVILNPRGEATPVFMLCGVFGYGYRLQQVAREMSPQIPAYILQPPGMDWSSASCSTLPEMTGWYVGAIERERPTGPLALLGTSFGGNMVFEIARQLQHKGRVVELLALVDTMPPEEDPQEFEALAEEIAHKRQAAKDPIELTGADMATVQLNALRTHRPEGTFAGTLHYFLATGAGFPGPHDRRFLWNRRATDGLAITCVSGIHGEFAKEPARSEIAAHLSALLTKQPAPPLRLADYLARHAYRIETRDKNGSLSLPDGTRLAIVTRRKAGRLDATKLYQHRLLLIGWAHDAAAKKAARMVLLFRREEFIHAAVPSQPRPDLAEAFGPEAAGSGYAILADFHSLAPARGDLFRVIALYADDAVELASFTWPPPEDPANPAVRLLRKMKDTFLQFRGD